MNKKNKKSLVDVEVLYQATNNYGDNIKEDIISIAKVIGKFNALSVLITKKRNEGEVEIDNAILINRDNLLRSAVKKILFLNQQMEVRFILDGKENMYMVRTRIDKSNFFQCQNLVDDFWFAMYEIADRKAKELADREEEEDR